MKVLFDAIDPGAQALEAGKYVIILVAVVLLCVLAVRFFFGRKKK